MERLAKEEAEELRRYEADLANTTQASLGTADAGTDAMDAGARASTDPAPATPAPGAATDDNKWPPLPRPAAKSEARRAPLTKQAIRTSRYPGAIFSLTARCTFDRYEGRCRRVGCSPPLPASAEAPATPSSSSGGPARRYRPGRMLSRRAGASSR